MKLDELQMLWTGVNIGIEGSPNETKEKAQKLAYSLSKLFALAEACQPIQNMFLYPVDGVNPVWFEVIANIRRALHELEKE